MKQTAVEWLESELKNSIGMPYKHFEEIINQAKAREKEQIKDAYNSDRPNLCAFTEGTAFKEYYKKTFKKK